MNEDVRWKQRFSNFELALNQLTEGIENNRVNPPSIVKEGIIQRFEFTHELAWKVMKNYLEYEGIQQIVGSRSATREAFNKGLISDGETWMNMIESRNNTFHTYDETILESEFVATTEVYYPLFKKFRETMKLKG